MANCDRTKDESEIREGKHALKFCLCFFVIIFVLNAVDRVR
jgi:hypothetical protein